MKLRSITAAFGLLLVAALPAAAPATAQPDVEVPFGLPEEVIGRVWEWVSFTTPVEEIIVDAPERYTIAFTADGQVALGADCNRGAGTYTVDGENRISFGPIALTRAMCPPGSLSDRFVREVGRVATFFLQDGDFFLELPIDSGTLRFHPTPDIGLPPVGAGEGPAR